MQRWSTRRLFGWVLEDGLTEASIASSIAPMNLDAYFNRIGYAGPRVVTHAVLAEIVLHHCCSIPFENLDAFLGRGVSLDPEEVEHKLISRRGGWCFEHNLLLGTVLRALGYEVVDLFARVLWGRSADAVTARTHQLLRVQADGRDWLVDVGFGGQTPTGVLNLHSKESQLTPHESFRLLFIDTDRLLESQVANEWLPLYRFNLQPQRLIDFEATNYHLAHDPSSPFTQELRVSLVTREGRHTLRGREFVFHSRNGRTQREELRDAQAICAALQDIFGIDIGGLPNLPQRIAETIA